MSLNRGLRLLASNAVLEEQENGNFALTDLGQFLRTDVPGSMHWSVRLFSGIGIQDAWKELDYCVRTGLPAFKKNNPDGNAFDNFVKNPEQAVVFNKAMATFAPVTAAGVSAPYDF